MTMSHSLLFLKSPTQNRIQRISKFFNWPWSGSNVMKNMIPEFSTQANLWNSIWLHYGVRQWQRFTVSPVGDSQGLLLLLFRRYSLHSGFYKGTTLLATYKRFKGPTLHRLTGNMMIVTYSSQTSLLTHLKAMVTS